MLRAYRDSIISANLCPESFEIVGMRYLDKSGASDPYQDL